MWLFSFFLNNTQHLWEKNHKYVTFSFFTFLVLVSRLISLPAHLNPHYYLFIFPLIVLSFSLLSSLFYSVFQFLIFPSCPALWKCCCSIRLGLQGKLPKFSQEGNIASAIKAAPASFPHLLLPKWFRFTSQLLNETRRRRDSLEFSMQSPTLSTSEARPNP